MSRAIIVPQADEIDIKTVLPPRANLSARGTSRQTSPARRRISRNSDRNPGVEGGSVVMGGPRVGDGAYGAYRTYGTYETNLCGCRHARAGGCEDIWPGRRSALHHPETSPSVSASGPAACAEIARSRS